MDALADIALDTFATVNHNHGQSNYHAGHLTVYALPSGAVRNSLRCVPACHSLGGCMVLERRLALVLAIKKPARLNVAGFCRCINTQISENYTKVGNGLSSDFF